MSTLGTSTLRAMPLWDNRERAMLVALLQERPRVASWPAVAVEINEAGSARSVRDAYHETSLFDADPPAPIVQAGRELAAWQAAGLGVHTFRDAASAGSACRVRCG